MSQTDYWYPIDEVLDFLPEHVRDDAIRLRAKRVKFGGLGEFTLEYEGILRVVTPKYFCKAEIT